MLATCRGRLHGIQTLDHPERTTSRSPTRHAVGVMTGTSIDGIDVALARTDGRGLELAVELVRHRSSGLGLLGRQLRAAADGRALTAARFAELSRELGLACADAVAECLDDGPAPDLIAVHGQTLYHRPPLSWQLLDPAPIARRLGCPVVFDLRGAALAAGGQGAPITPLADWVMLRHRDRSRAVVNLGGFCNVTVLPCGNGGSPADVRGFDVCACNQSLDAVARAVLGQPFDEGGRTAARGTPQPQAVKTLAAQLARQSGAGRSLGTGDDVDAWVQTHRHLMTSADLAASAVVAVAGCIGERLRRCRVDEIVLAGGGALNDALLDALRGEVDAPVVRSDELGLDPQAREALAMAVLGVLCADDVPITLPQITGCAEPAPVAGVWIGGPARS
jgi:1,6-anhydro-N-acetylmuramate kinase